MTAFNQKLLRMLHGAIFSKRAPLAAGGKEKPWGRKIESFFNFSSKIG
jgi:hypothetical protein